MKKETVVEIKTANVKHATIHIVGDSDLVLNKVNASNERALIAEDRKAASLWEAQHNNKWEQIITAIHWRDPLPCKDTNAECNEDMMQYLAKNNAPCITAFGLKKSWGQSVTRNEIDKYSTKFDNAVNVVAKGGKVPIKFTDWVIDERLMSPKRGAPISVKLSHFIGWSADIEIMYTDNVYSLSEIVTVINYAGFGLGIGSGRSSGYGRYHVVDVKA